MMGQDGQLHKVICKRCKDVLQDGINPPKYMLGPCCINKEYPAAPGGLRDANGKRIGEEKPNEQKISVDTEIHTLTPEDPEKETLVVITFIVTDYFKKERVRFSANYEQITEIYNQMTKLHLEHNGGKNERIP